MAQPDHSVVASLTQFVEEVERLLEVAKARNPNVPLFQNWYRGVTLSQEHKLQASLYRINRASDLEYLNLEAQMMLDFERHAILRTTTGPDNEDHRTAIMKLFHMQHYGVPTRLLDWTTNPFVGLYFALSKGVDAGQNPAVWVLDPWSWNRDIFKRKAWKDLGPAHVSHYTMRGYHPKERYDAHDLMEIEPHPAPVIGVYNTERMRAQRGVFAMFGRESARMEDVYHAENVAPGSLFRIEIDRTQAEVIFEKLIQLGYTDSVTYPDFQGVAMEIRRTHGYTV